MTHAVVSFFKIMAFCERNLPGFHRIVRKRVHVRNPQYFHIHPLYYDAGEALQAPLGKSRAHLPP
jgi:hypothetical protein